LETKRKSIQLFKMSWQTEEADIVFIGAGPVGLITAILTAEKAPFLKILILEKYEEYQRFHHLQVDPGVYKYLPYTSCIKSLLAGQSGWKEYFKPIKELQAELEALAMGLGIIILKGKAMEVHDPAVLLSQFPNARSFVGSDGARSHIRREVFKDEFWCLEKLGFQAHVRYQVENSMEERPKVSLSGTDPTKWISPSARGSLRACRAMNHSLLEERVVGNGPYMIQLVFQVNEEVFNELEGANHAHPHQLHELPKSLRDDINLWRGVKKQFQQERSVTESVRITAVKIEFKLTWKAHTTFQGKDFYLVGDAAASFPYRLGFNLGAACAIKLSTALTSQISHQEYNDYVRQEATRTIQEAKKWKSMVGLWTMAVNTIPMMPRIPFIHSGFKLGIIPNTVDLSESEKEGLRRSVYPENEFCDWETI